MRRAAAIGAALVAFFSGLSSVQAQNQDRGRTLYENNCAMCHGTTGKGDGPGAGALSSPPPNFRQPKFWTGNGEKKIRTAIENGYGAMPPAGLKPDEIKAVTDYMMRTFGE